MLEYTSIKFLCFRFCSVAMSAGFLRPTDDDFAPTWTEDKVDIEPSKETTFVYNPNANWNLAGGLTITI